MVLVRPGFAPLTHVTTMHRDETVVLPPATWKPGVQVAGAVVSEAGEPLTGVVVTVDPIPVSLAQKTGRTKEDPCVAALAEAGVTVSRTAKDGIFVLGPLPPGALVLRFSKEGFEKKVLQEVFGPHPWHRDLGRIILREKGDLHMDFDLSQVDETFPFEVTLERENPRQTLDLADQWILGEVHELKDDAPLDVELDPGTYRIVFSKQGTDIDYVQLVMVTPGENDVLLRPWPIRIYGTVSDSDGRIPDAKVLLSCSGVRSSTRTDRDGRYELAMWTAAHCGVFVTTSDGRKHIEHLDLSQAELGDSVEVLLDVPNNVVSGTVVDAEDGEPIAGAKVEMMQTLVNLESSSNVETVADDEGRFTFKGALGESASTALRAQAKGYLPATKNVAIADDVPVPEVEIKLQPSASVSGRVIGPGGEPVAGARVSCCPLGLRGRFSVSATSAADGSFELDAARNTVVFASAEGYSVGWGHAADNGGELVIRLGARPPATRIRVVNSDMDPVSGIFVTFSVPGLGILPVDLLGTDAILNSQRPVTDANGVVMCSALPPGVYRAWLVNPAGQTVEIGVVPFPSPGEVTVHVPEPRDD